MTHASTAEPEAMEEISVRRLWQEATGKVFKLTSKTYGVSTVTYTQVKAVKDTDAAGGFEIEVLCAEITARVLSGKRTHSNICKEGVLPQDAGSELMPDSFGGECPAAEFEKVIGAILAYTNSYLDWVMQEAPEEKTEIEVSIDLPHLKLTDMEASLVRNSPFLMKDLYFLTTNSIQAALASIHQELQRASRNTRLADAVDAVYVAQKNEALASLQAKLQNASPARMPSPAPRAPGSCDPMALIHSNSRVTAAASGRRSVLAALELDSLTLALLGKPSTTVLRWLTANPSEDGAVFELGADCAPLDFVRWAHVTGAMLPETATEGRDLRGYFGGLNHSYTGPDKEGIYPLLRPATE